MINPIIAQYIAEIRHAELIAEADRNLRAGRRRRRTGAAKLITRRARDHVGSPAPATVEPT